MWVSCCIRHIVGVSWAVNNHKQGYSKIKEKKGAFCTLYKMPPNEKNIV